MKIKETPTNLRPREKLKRLGSYQLDDRELIAIIISKGTKHNDVLKISNNIIKKYDVETLRNASITELKKIKGLGEVTAIKLKAALELGSRQKIRDKIIIKNSKDVFNICKDMKFLKKEHFVILMLDTKNQLIKKEVVSIGTLNLAIIHPREIFKEAIKESANSIILVHNHPSGNSEPSDADIDITNKLIKAGELLDIRVLDHVIIGNKYYSFSDIAKEHNQSLI
ncbi:MAG: RadC family protein [Candidatus Woesearchaeota archaeon]